MPDIQIQCCDCPNQFIFTEGEQAYFAAQKPVPFNPPRRCKSCRQLKKERNAQRDVQGQKPAPQPSFTEEERPRSKSNKPRRDGGHW